MRPSVIYDDPGPRWIWLLLLGAAAGIVLAYCMSPVNPEPVRETPQPTWTPATASQPVPVTMTTIEEGR